MTAPKPNAELAYRVLDHIDAHPEQWKQSMWVGQAECGTVGCFAGWTCLLSGEQPMNDEFLGIMLRSGMPIPDRAEQLLGASRFVTSLVDGMWEDEDLFHEYNTREDLGRLVAEIFGPRPEPEALECLRCRMPNAVDETGVCRMCQAEALADELRAKS